jgi:hypothetical protein
VITCRSVVFQYLIYTDGTDNLKYVTKGAKGGVGFSAEEVLEPAVSLGWNSGGGEIENKKALLNVEAKTKWTAQWKYICQTVK